MATALRPYLTTGAAIAGASIIAVAPITVAPPDLPAVEVAAADAVRTVTTDVELTALLDDLVAAVTQSVTETIKLYTETLPATAANLISTGRFAHLAVLAVNTAYLTPLTIIAPFAVGFMQAIPKPFGTLDGVINESLKMIIQTPAVAGISILSLFASIIDDGLSPFDAVVGSFGYLTDAFTKTIESLEKIVATFAGALPIAALAPPQDLAQARQQTLAAPTATASVDDPNVVPASVNSVSSEGSGETVTVSVDTPAAAEAGGAEDETPIGSAPPEDDESSDESQAGDDTTPNGGTDLSDGNQAEPGGGEEESTNADNDGSNPATETEVDAQGAAGGETADAPSDTATGSGESAGDDGASQD
jgi:hypothetical protein